MTGPSFIALADESQSTKAGFIGEPAVRGPPWARMPLLTIAMLGVQIVWSVEMAWASPYLHDELGVKKSLVAVVFLAGPISGLVVQPLIGVLADHSTSRFGRRRPYIAIGGLICVCGILTMGFTRNIASVFTKLGTSANQHLTVALAVLSIFCIDFSINAVMASNRALLVDILPTEDQPQGNAWAGAMFALGSVAGFFLGSSNLPKYLPFLGSKQLEALSSLATIIFIFTSAIVAFSVKEQVLVNPSKKRTTFFGIFRDIWVNIRTLPYVIKQICLTQFFAWIGWFPFLFYMTIYIGEVYVRSLNLPEGTSPTKQQQDEGTRTGNRAMLFHAICSLLASTFVPFIVREKGKNKRWAFIELGTLWALSLLLLGVCLIAIFLAKTVIGVTMTTMVVGISWAVTQWVPFALLGEAILSEDELAVDTMRESIESIALLDGRSSRRGTSSPRRSGEPEEGDERQFLIGRDEDEEQERGKVYGGHAHSAGHHDGDDDDPDSSMEAPHAEGDEQLDWSQRKGKGNLMLRNEAARRSVLSITKPGSEGGDDLDAEGRDYEFPPSRSSSRSRRKVDMEVESIAAKAGIILGIHNVFLVIPQFLSTAIASVIFKIYEPSHSVLDGPHPGPSVGHKPITNSTTTTTTSSSTSTAALALKHAWAHATIIPEHLVKRNDEKNDDSSPDSLGVIFCIGGVCAIVASVLAWRLSRYLKTRR